MRKSLLNTTNTLEVKFKLENCQTLQSYQCANNPGSTLA